MRSPGLVVSCGGKELIDQPDKRPGLWAWGKGQNVVTIPRLTTSTVEVTDPQLPVDDMLRPVNSNGSVHEKSLSGVELRSIKAVLCTMSATAAILLLLHIRPVIPTLP